MRSFQAPLLLQTGDEMRTQAPSSSTASIQPLLAEAPVYQSSTSSVTLTTLSTGPEVNRTTLLGLTARSEEAPRAPGAFHGTFLGRVMRKSWQTPAPHS